MWKVEHGTGGLCHVRVGVRAFSFLSKTIKMFLTFCSARTILVWSVIVELISVCGRLLPDVKVEIVQPKPETGKAVVRFDYKGMTKIYTVAFRKES